MRIIYFTASIKQSESINNSHILQLPHNFNTSNQIHLALKSCDIFLNESNSPHSYLKIEVLEVNNHEIVKENRNLISVIYKFPRNSRVIFEGKNLAFLSFDNQSLSHLTIRLKNERDEIVKLDSVATSFLRFAMKKVEVETRPDVHLYQTGRLASNGFFRFDLPRYLNIEKGSWQMALSCIGFPDPNSFIKPEKVEAKFIYGTNFEKVSLSNPALQSSHHYFWNGIRMGLYKVLRAEYGKLKLNAVENTQQISSELSKPLHIQFDRYLGYLLGVSSDFNECNRVITINPGKVEKFEDEVNMNRRLFNGVIVKSSILQPSIFNGRYSPLLRVIPIQNPTDYYFENFHNLEFVEISPSSLSNIDLQICNENEFRIAYPHNNEIKLFAHIVIRFIDQ